MKVIPRSCMLFQALGSVVSLLSPCWVRSAFMFLVVFVLFWLLVPCRGQLFFSEE